MTLDAIQEDTIHEEVRSRYAAAASKTQHSGQRLYPIADRACPQDSKWAKKSVTPNRASVTYVLDQMCYLCPDPTAAIFSLQPLVLSLSPHSRSAYPFEKNRLNHSAVSLN